MTLSSTENRIGYNCDGATKSFSFPYAYYNKDHIKVVRVTIASDAENELTLDTDYSLTDVPAPDGGTITTLAADALSSDYRLVIYREVSAKQETDLINGDALPEDSVERTFDLAVMMVQQMLEKLGRIPSLPVGSTLSDLVLPSPGAGLYLRWNSAGDNLETADVAEAGLLSVSSYGETIHSVINNCE